MKTIWTDLCWAKSGSMVVFMKKLLKLALTVKQRSALFLMF